MGGSRSIILYGRRRVGETRLLIEFLKSIPEDRYVFFLASRRPLRYNLAKFSHTLSGKLNVSLPLFGNLLDLLKFLSSLKKQGFLVVFDEFNYLVESDEGVLSDIQEFLDLHGSETGIKIILSGSIVGMIESRILGYSSPLYGRSDISIKLKPLDFSGVNEWFGKTNFKENFKIYAVTGGVPRYLEFFRGENVLMEIENNFFNSSSFLFRDALELLREELRDPSVYLTILEAIALGYNKLSEISNYTYLEPVKLTSYISTLRELGIVKRLIPVFSPKKSKRGIYVIDDYYFAFWTRFVSPYFDEIDSGFYNTAIMDFKKNFNTYLGIIYEDFVRKNIQLVLNSKGYYISKVGKWWKGQLDIDIIARDEINKYIFLCEVKWKDLGEKDIDKIMGLLEERLKFLPQRIISGYKIKYVIIGKEISASPSEDTILVELRDFISKKPGDKK